MNDLIEGEHPVLRCLAPVSTAASAQGVEHVTTEGNVRKGSLVVVRNPSDWHGDVQQMRQRAAFLARAGAVGLVVTEISDADARLLSVPTAVPVLVPTAPSTAAELVERILRLQVEATQAWAQAEQRRVRLAEQYAELLSRLLLDGRGPDALVHHLQQCIGGRVTLLSDLDHARALAPLLEHGAALQDLVAGRTSEALWLTSPDEQALVHPVGNQPYRLMVAIRPQSQPWSGSEQALIQRTALGVTSVLRAESLDVREARLAEASMAIRVSVFQHLMDGNLPSAARAAQPLLPGFVSAGAGEVLIVEGAPGENRGTLASEVERTLRSQHALVLLCPVQHRQVIALVPSGRSAGTAMLLDPVVGALPGRVAGVSPATPWEQTETAYDQATEALEEGRSLQGRIAVHDGRAALVGRLGLDARIWAAQLLRPATERSDCSQEERQNLLRICRTAIFLGEAEAMNRLGGWSVSTISKKLTELSRMCGLSRNSLWDRVALDLALRLSTLPPPTPKDLERQVSLSVALDHPRAQEWKREVLKPLSGELRELLVTWVRHNLSSQDTAAALGIHRNTVSKALRRAGTLTHLMLSYPGKRHELALALYLDGAEDLAGWPQALDRRLNPEGTTARPISAAERKNGEADQASTARMYDYYLGGTTNYVADRRAAQAVIKNAPATVVAARSNRSFGHRATLWLAKQGLRQFLDLGTGVLTPPSLHEIARSVDESSRVVYVDRDPEVVAYAPSRLIGSPGQSAYIQADITDPASVLDSPELLDVLDFRRPVALSMNAVVQSIRDDQDPQRIVRCFVDRLATGSYLVFTHLTPDFDPEMAEAIEQEYRRCGYRLTFRSLAEIEPFFHGLELVEPGIVSTQLWHPDEPEYLWPTNAQACMWGGVARVP
ncbi:SAM-dependent methyltransferase [Streptomyces sp. NPDC008343]|uniref:SAM-dependent methyltransferase n=1 Tax=Streptomyces sp. NPDC008343 TaxID=3364828 RepID=UPI0036DFFA65